MQPITASYGCRASPIRKKTPESRQRSSPSSDVGCCIDDLESLHRTSAYCFVIDRSSVSWSKPQSDAFNPSCPLHCRAYFNSFGSCSDACGSETFPVIRACLACFPAFPHSARCGNSIKRYYCVKRPSSFFGIARTFSPLNIRRACPP